MRILLTGSSGFLGWNLAARLAQEASCELFCAHGANRFGLDLPARRLDLESRDSIRETIEWAQPDTVIHCAAMAGLNDCEVHPERAERINCGAVGDLIEALEARGAAAHIVFCSTDMVFDGLHSPYTEEAPTAPHQVYGQTKHRAEQRLMGYPGPWSIARLSLMYGQGPSAHRSFLGWLDSGLRSPQGVQMFRNEYRTALYGPDAAEALTRIARRGAQGIFHLGGPERLSRAEFALTYARIFELDAARVHGVPLPDPLESPVYRPPDLTLDIARARSELDFAPRTAEEALRHLKNQENLYTAPAPS